MHLPRPALWPPLGVASGNTSEPVTGQPTNQGKLLFSPEEAGPAPGTHPGLSPWRGSIRAPASGLMPTTLNPRVASGNLGGPGA